MKPVSEERPGPERGRGAPQARSRPIVAAIAAGMLAASIGLLLLCGRDGTKPPAATAPPPPPSEAAAPARPPPGGGGALRGRRDEPAAPAAEPRLPRAVARRRAEPGAAPVAGAAGEQVIENVPGQELPPGVDAGDAIAALQRMGATEGIAAFPPPGTSPPKAGVIVPDDYELPEGYARHYQSSDDGRPLAPILVYAPDYEFLDEDGEPIPIPEDRVVPPDRAPPDLPVRLLDPAQPGEREGLIGQAP